jgi:hypothetical protein
MASITSASSLFLGLAAQILNFQKKKNKIGRK